MVNSVAKVPPLPPVFWVLFLLCEMFLMISSRENLVHVCIYFSLKEILLCSFFPTLHLITKKYG